MNIEIKFEKILNKITIFGPSSLKAFCDFARLDVLETYSNLRTII